MEDINQLDPTFDDLEDGLYSTPRGPGANDGLAASGWRIHRQRQGTDTSSVLGYLGNTARRISDQFQGQSRQDSTLGDLDEAPEETNQEHEEDIHEENEDDPQDTADPDEQLRRLRAQVAALTRANKSLQHKMTSTSSRPSITSHSSKFVRLSDVPDSDLLDTQVTLSKANYGQPGSSDYRKNMLMATTGLSEKFGVAKHKVISDTEAGDQDKSMYVQQVIVSVIHRVKEGLQRSQSMDWMSICKMPHLIALDATADPESWWDNSEINVWTDPELLTLDEVRAWQYCINKRFAEADRIASTWLKEFVYNSSTDALKTAVIKKYDKIPANQRGGAVYLYLTLMEMFQMSREVKDAMLFFLSLFKRKGISRYVGENVLLASEEVLGVCKRLDAGKGLLEEHVIDVLTGLSICGNPRFREMFKHLKQCADLGNLDFLHTISISDSPLTKIEAILDKAVDVYDKLCVAGVWLKIDKSPQQALTAKVNSCWNCGGPHQVPECKKPRDPVTYEKNKKAFYDKKRAGDDKNSSSRGKRNDSRGSNVDKSSPEYQRKVWEAAGIKMDGGTLKVKCKTCGYNTTHSTRLHDAWAANPSTFRLDSKHPYAQECAKLKQSPSCVPCAPPAPTANSNKTVTFDKATLEQKISAFERNSTNPNASDISDAMRAFFLN